MTTGTRRNGTSKLGPFTWPATAQYGEPGRQALDGRVVVELDGFDVFDGYGESSYRDYASGEYGYAPYDEPGGYGDVGPGGYGDLGPVGYVPAVQVVQTALADHEAGPGEPRDAGHAPQPGRTAGRYAGRHASTRAKTARKRPRRVVPVAAVAAATIAAGSAAAYGLTSGGQPQSGNLNASLALHGGVASTLAPGAGQANGSSAAPISIATATASGTAHVPKHAKAAPRTTPATTPPAAPKHAAPATSAPAPAKHAAAPAASSPPAATKPAAATTLSCNLNYGLLPENVTAIVSFLLANGYTDNAAAGIAGNIYQESKGNVESVGMGGGGLIGWTPLPSGFVTGNVSADLQTQLSALLTYNQGWAQFLPALNSAASPAAAADIYVTDFERAGVPAAGTREAAAEAVAAACGI